MVTYLFLLLICGLIIAFIEWIKAPVYIEWLAEFATIFVIISTWVKLIELV